MVITGSTRGIGLIMAKALVAAGAKVVISSRSPDMIHQATSGFPEADQSRVLGVPCDVTQLDQVEALAVKTIDHFGPIDAWFNNAALNRYFGPIVDLPVDHWRQVIDTNVNGMYYGTIVALKQLLPRNQGKIINLLGAGSSDSAANSYLGAYATSKAAARRFTLVVAEDYRDTGLSILGLNPGLSSTQLTLEVEPLNGEAQRRMKFLDFGLTWLATDPGAIAKMAVHLVSDATKGKTGKIYRCLPGVWANLQRRMAKPNNRSA